LHSRLGGETIDVLFVNAGISLGHDDTLDAVSTEAFTALMITNALSPLRVIETFADLVPAGGIIAAMSSGLGSVADNAQGGMEAYRASKAALNMLLKSLAARRGAGRAVLAVAPGWVRTDMGGPNAPLDVPTSARGMVDAMAAWRGRAGVAFIDYRGATIAW
jgi:NAD(P)-dependent dehydrogenase (short-subunit alcohol dehydrogenase family)